MTNASPQDSEDDGSTPTASWQRWQRWLLFLLLLIAALNTARPLWNTDLFWHLSSGRLFLEQGALPTQDPLTYTAGEREWVHHEWLTQIVLASAEKAVGLAGLRWLRATLATLGLVLLWWLSRRRATPGAVLITLGFAWIGLAPNASLRPHLVVWPLAVVLLTALTPAIVGRFDSSKERRATYFDLFTDRSTSLLTGLFFGLVTLWVNAHSSALIVPLLLGVLTAGSVIDRLSGRLTSWRPTIAAAALTSLAALACLLQPAGFDLVAYAGVTPETNVRSQEWSALWSLETWQSFPAVLICWVLLATAVVIAGVRERLHVAASPSPEFWPALACLVLAAQHRRMSLFFFLPALYVAPHLSTGLERLLAAAPRPGWRKALIAVFLAACATLALAALPDALLPGALRQGLFPEQAADFLAAAELEGRLFHDINWGGYLGFRRYPQQQVFADGRWVLAGEQAMADYPRLYLRSQSPATVEALFDRYEIEVMVQSTRDVLQRPSVQPHNWRLAWVGPMATVLVRRGPSFEANVRRLCELYKRHPQLEQRARWPVEVKPPNEGLSPTDVEPIWQLCRW